MHDKWEEFKKNKNRKSNTERSKRKTFCKDLQKLFDIAAENAQEVIYADRLRTKIAKEDVAFLRDQKSTRKMQISSMDCKTKSSYERKRRRTKSALEYEQQQSTSTAIDLPAPSNQSDSNSRSESASSGEECTATASSSKRNIKNNDELITLQFPRKILRSEKISQMADRTNWSSNAYFSVVASVIQSSSADVEDFVISSSTGRRARSLNRQTISSEIKQSFTPPTYAVVRWDEKIIKDSMDQNKEHVAVAISGSPNCKNGKLLGVEKTEFSSGINQANAVNNLSEEWNCSDNVNGLSFDTTSSNTGRISRAAVLLEDRLHKKLLW